ncbi:MAG: twin-arginine translocase TatA/TatE family subunit [Nitrospinae bacterium]|jgi:sec-independent protein translocase protein TatA|nr:twin-arginine translocase TatA/TatE family subunit [Nitrospinota bacterium]
MMGIGFPELMIILVIIMIIFGAGKLPEIGSAFGRSIKNFKTSMKEAEEEDAPVGDQPAAAIEEGKGQGLDDPNLTDEEREALKRKIAQEAGDAKDLAMKETADAFTASLPRKGSYDFSKEQEESKKS